MVKISQTSKTTGDQPVAGGVKPWPPQPPLPDMTPEQILLWLDGVRAFMFEVWRCNPELRRAYERAHAAGIS